MKPSNVYNSSINFSLILLIVMGVLISAYAVLNPLTQTSRDQLPLKVESIKHYIDTPQLNQAALSIDNIMLDDAIISEPTPNPTAFGHNPNPIWIKIVISNPNDNKMAWILDTDNNVLQTARIYERSLKNPNQYTQIYNHASPRIQNIPYITPAVATTVALQGHEKKIIYLQVQGSMSTHMHLSFEDRESAVKSHSFKNIIMASVTGIILTLIFVNLIFYFSLRKMQYIYYCLQELMVVSFILSYAGYVMHYFHSDNGAITSLYLAAMPLLLILTSSLFIDSFLNVGSFSYALRKLPKIYAAVSAALIVLSFVSFSQLMILQYIIPPFLLSFIFVAVYLGIRAVLNGQYYAIAFCAGWLFLLVSLIISVLSITDVYQVESINHVYAWYFGYVMEGALLSLAMGMQVSSLRKQNEAGKEKLNKIFIERSVEAQELQHAYKASRQAEDEKNKKSKHLASASHDINHSLFLMKVNLEGLKNETNQQEINNTLSSVDYLQGITEDILSVGQIDNKNPIGLIDTKALFEQLYNELSPLAKQKNIRLRYRINHITELDASKVIVKRILENLIRNGIQHTQTGGVLFSLRERKDNYQLQVFDSGCGMHQDTIKSLHQAFSQSADSNMGYGMGLYIVSNLCQQSGYALKVTTRLNGGSVFTILINK